MGFHLQSVCYLQQLLGFDVRVGLQVCLEVGALVEAPLADGTPVWRLLEVEDLVNSKSAGLTETLATVLALEWLLFGMNVSVVSEIRGINIMTAGSDSISTSDGPVF